MARLLSAEVKQALRFVLDLAVCKALAVHLCKTGFDLGAQTILEVALVCLLELFCDFRIEIKVPETIQACGGHDALLFLELGEGARGAVRLHVSLVGRFLASGGGFGADEDATVELVLPEGGLVDVNGQVFDFTSCQQGFLCLGFFQCFGYFLASKRLEYLFFCCI